MLSHHHLTVSEQTAAGCLPVVLYSPNQLYSIHQTSCILFTKPVVLYSPNQLYSSHQTSCIIFTKPVVLYSPNQLYSSHQTSCILFTKPVVFYSPDQLYSIYQTSCILVTKSGEAAGYVHSCVPTLLELHTGTGDYTGINFFFFNLDPVR